MSFRPDQARHQRRIPSAACAQLKHLVPWAQSQKVEHPKHEGRLRDRRGDIVIVLTKEDQGSVRVKRRHVLLQVLFVDAVPLLGPPLAVRGDEQMPGRREIGACRCLADRRVVVDVLTLLQELPAIFLRGVHTPLPG